MPPKPANERVPHKWLQLLAEQSGQIYWAMSLNPPRMLYVSPAFERIWKMPVATILGDPQIWIDTIIEEDRGRVTDLYDSLLARSTDRYDVSYRIIDGHGELRWIRDTGSVVGGTSGDEPTLVGIAEDLTELRRSEHTLRQRLEWFDLITTQSPVVFWTVDRKLRFTSSAGRGLRHLELVSNQINETSLFEYFQTQDHEFLPIKMHLRALQGHDVQYELAWSNRMYKTTLRPFRDAAGSVIGVIGAALDVTEEQQAQAAVRESAETYRTLIEFNPELVALVVDGKLSYVNQSLQRVTGYTLEEMMGRSPVEFVIPEDRPRAAERIQAVMSGDTPRTTEYRTIRKDGALRVIDVLAQRISYQGRPALVAFIRDVTERKAIEDELRRHGQELERLVEERTVQIRELEHQRSESEKLAATGRMAARVAHEINNPLAGIKTAFRLIRDSIAETHPHFQYVELIDHEIDRIAGIVQLMYRLYRPGRTEWKLLSVEKCVRDVVALQALTAEKHGITLEIGELSCPPTRLPVGHLEQILFNVIQNAIEASPVGERVTIVAGPSPLGIAIDICDRGPGIAPELRSCVFEPFFSTKTEGDSAGLGLGLSVTRSLAESIGGSVDFSDRPGGGAIFTILLPSEQSNQGVSHGQSPSPVAGG